MNVYIERHVSAKTAAHMNRLFDKEFAKLILIKKEIYTKTIKELFI